VIHLLDHLNSTKSFVVGLLTTGPAAFLASINPGESWFAVASGFATGTFAFFWAAYKLSNDKMLERTEARLAKAEAEIDERIKSEREAKLRVADLEAELRKVKA
jgi:hypothetical protein